MAFIKNRKKFFYAFGGILLITVILSILNFIPTWNLKTSSMTKLEGNWCNVYYETEKGAALDVFELADEQTEQIAKDLGFLEKQDVNIYIYDDQKTMQRKKYGFIGLCWVLTGILGII